MNEHIASIGLMTFFTWLRGAAIAADVRMMVKKRMQRRIYMSIGSVYWGLGLVKPWVKSV